MNKKLSRTSRLDSITLLTEWAWDNRKQNSKEAANYLRTARQLTSDSMMYYQLTRQLAQVLRFKGNFYIAFDTLEYCAAYFNRQDDALALALTNFELSSLHADMGSTDLSDSLLSISKPILIENAHPRAFIRSYLIDADNHFHQGQYDLARATYMEALQASDMSAYSHLKSTVLQRFGFFEQQLGNYDVALEHCFEALELGLEDYNKYQVLIYISNIYQLLEDWDQGLRYQLEALEVANRLNNPLAAAYVLMEIGYIHLHQEKQEEALPYLERAFEVAKMEDNQYAFQGVLLKVTGETLRDVGQTEMALVNFEEAANYLRLSIENSEVKTTDKNQNNRDANKIRSLLALVLFELNQLDNSRATAEKCLQMGATENDQYVALRMNELLAKIYTAQGLPQEASVYEAAYLQIEKDLVGFDEMRKITNLEQKINQNKLDADTNPASSGNESHQWLWLIGLLSIILPTAWIFKNKMQIVPKNTNYTNDPFPSESTIKSMSTFLLDKIETEEDWVNFTAYFQHVHPNFFKRLKEQYPTITPNELNICALLKLNIQNKEMAQLLGISPDSVRKAQHRLSKKIDLTNHKSVRDYITVY
ncbi:MAG: tetratricopeptide repeat protein [Bacteroidota bacterium]